MNKKEWQKFSLILKDLLDEVNISFYDYTARKICNVPKDKLLVSIPYNKIPGIIQSIDKCSAGRAKIEYLGEFLHRLSQNVCSMN